MKESKRSLTSALLAAGFLLVACDTTSTAQESASLPALEPESSLGPVDENDFVPAELADSRDNSFVLLGDGNSAARERLIEAFRGTALTELLPEDFSEDRIRIAVRKTGVATNRDGETKQVSMVEHQTVNPLDEKLTPEQRLGVLVSVHERLIREKQESLLAVEDDGRPKIVKELRELYAMRFELDTAYQDFRVREIERRANKLREEVDSRETAAKQWVDAMVTLAEMRASGIATMPPLSGPRVESSSGMPVPVGVSRLRSPRSTGVAPSTTPAGNSFNYPSPGPLAPSLPATAPPRF